MKWIDLHCDTLSILTGGADTGIERCRAGLRENNLCVDARRLKEAGAAAQFFACYVNASDFCNGEVSRNGEIWDRAYRKILSMTAYAACAQDERFRIARSAEDIMNMESAAQTAGILTVEEGGVLNGSTERLDKLYDSGVRLITLTWNYENCIGSPNSREPGLMQRGLTPFGVQAVERMNDAGHDRGCVAPVGRRLLGLYPIQRRNRSWRPTLTPGRSVPHPRNLSDEMLRALGDRGGVGRREFLRGVSAPGRARGCHGYRPPPIRHMMDRAGERTLWLWERTLTVLTGILSRPGSAASRIWACLWDAMKARRVRGASDREGCVRRM